MRFIWEQLSRMKAPPPGFAHLPHTRGRNEIDRMRWEPLKSSFRLPILNQNMVLLTVSAISLLAGCAEPTPTVTPTAAPPTSTDLPTLTPTVTLTPTITPTNTPRPTAGPGLGELLATPENLLGRQLEVQAGAAYDELGELYPARAEPLLGQAEIARLQEDGERQLALTRQALETEPGSSVAYRALADLYDEQGVPSPDLTRFGSDPQPEIFPEFVWIDAAAAAYANADYKTAVDLTTVGLNLFPESEGLHFARGLALLSEGEAEDAAADFEGASMIDPTDVGVMLWHGRALAAAGRADEAVRILQRAGILGLDQQGPALSDGYEAMGDAGGVLGLILPGETFEYLGEQVFRYGSLDPFILGYARADLARGQLELAIFRLFDLVDDDYLPAYYWLAVAYVEDDREDAAVAILEEYLEIEKYGPSAESARRLLDELE